MVRSGRRASSRKTAVASKPMNPANAIIRPTPGAPEAMLAGSNGARDSPSGPPSTTTAAASASTMPISATSTTPSTLELSSTCR
jgi:hypothetical protein